MTNDTLDPMVSQRLDAALEQDQPEAAVRAVVRSLITEGRTRGEVVRQLEGYRTGLTDERERDDELLIDVMAVLDGLASFSVVRKLLPPPCVADRPWRMD